MMNISGTYGRLKQKGNVLFALFAAIGLVGVAGATSVTLMKGPVRGMSQATQMKIVTADLSAAATLLSRQALGTTGADCDTDGKTEPMAPRSAGSLPKPTGGGYLPAILGTTKIDPWKTEYGYCAWDHGTVVQNASCGGAAAGRLSGGDTTAGTAIAVISAGPDRTFQTTCSAWANDTTATVNKPAGSDDIVKMLSYQDFTTPSGGDAKLEELPDEACTPQNIGIMRRFAGVVQVCMDTGWEEVGTSAQADTDFIDVTGAQLNSTHTSNEITFSGFLNTKNVSVTGGATLLVNGAVRALPATVVAGDKVSLRANAAATPEQDVRFEVSIGGVKRDWVIRTRNFYPAALSITPASANNMNVVGPLNPAYGSAVGFVIRNTGELDTVALSAAVLSNLTNFEFTGIGDDCGGKILTPGATCAIEIRSKAAASTEGTPFNGTLEIVAGSVSASASLSGNSRGWTCARPWGGTRMTHGENITAFNTTAPATCNGACPSITRTCDAVSNPAIVSGNSTYQYADCKPLQNCTYSWDTTAWNACPATPSWSAWSGWSGCSTGSCGPGTQTRNRTCQNRTGTQIRTVRCKRNDGVFVDDSLCSGAGTKPGTTQSCTNNCVGAASESQACGSWSYYYGGWGGWSGCSASCGGGAQYAYRSCYRCDGAAVDCSYCGGGCSTSQSCNTHSCIMELYSRSNPLSYWLHEPTDYGNPYDKPWMLTIYWQGTLVYSGYQAREMTGHPAITQYNGYSRGSKRQDLGYGGAYYGVIH